MARASRRTNQPQIIYQRVDDACTFMLKITYYPDTYERKRELVPIDDVPPQYRCSPSSRFGFSADNFVGMASNIVAAYVKNNAVAVADLPNVIQAVHGSLCSLEKGAAEPAVNADKKTASEILNSVRPDAIISFIDSKPYKTLKRHLRSRGMSMAEYQDKFGLPENYPTVAADYAAQRSRLARSLGLGQTGKASASSQAPHEDVKATKPARRRREPRPS